MLPCLSATEIAEGHGHRLGRGVHRTGYAVEIGGEAFCIKLANNDYGAQASIAEIQGWASLQEVEAERRQHFCEVVASDPDGSFVVMPLCQEADNYQTWHAQVGLGLAISGVCSDLHPGNVMRHPDGRIVITDYGFGVDTNALSSYDPSNIPPAYAYTPECSCSDCAPRPTTYVWAGACPGTPRNIAGDCVVPWGHPGMLRCEGCGWYFADGVCDCAGCVAHRAAA